MKITIGKLAPKQVRAGQRIYLYTRKSGVTYQFTQCCECGLKHAMEYKQLRRRLRVRAWRLKN